VLVSAVAWLRRGKRHRVALFVVSLPSLLAILLLLPSCACIHFPKQCCAPERPVERKRALLYGDATTGKAAKFTSRDLAGGDRTWKVFVPAEGPQKPDGPPILLLHEMFALSPGVLELALRLRDAGYVVYVPLLFGGELDNNNNKALGAWRFLDLAFLRPSWRGVAEGERKVTRQLTGLCKRIQQEHPGRGLGLIGLCLTGILPLQIVGQADPPPQVRAIVVSQPSIPLIACSSKTRFSLGISVAELQRARAYLEREDVRFVGFRFQLDPISPPERFESLHRNFGDRFVDHTVPARDYVLEDGMPSRAHAVLTDGFCRPHTGEHQVSAGMRAYDKLKAYLAKALPP